MIAFLPLIKRLRGVYYGWWLVASGVLLQTLQVGLFDQAYAVYLPALQSDFGWSTTTLAAAYSLLQLIRGVVGPLQGWLLMRYEPRTVMLVGVLLLSGGFVAFSQVGSLVAFFAAFSLMALGYSLAGFLTVTSIVVNWFERKRSRALAFSQLGVTFGGLVLPAVAWALDLAGWRTTAFASGLLVLVCGVPLTRLMRSSPERYGLRPDGDAPLERSSHTIEDGAAAPPPSPTRSRPDFTVKQALRTRAFWFLSFGHALALMTVSAVNVHAVVHLNTALGYSLPAAASVIAAMTAFAVVGQLLGGFAGDHFPKRLLATFAMWLHAASLFTLAYGGSSLAVALFTVGNGLAWGVRAPLMQAIRADYFGRKAFATIMGYAFLIAMFGTMSGPLIAGFFVDLFGNYRLGFASIAGLALFGSLLFLLATEPKPPES